jgi:hypothetical protein
MGCILAPTHVPPDNMSERTSPRDMTLVPVLVDPTTRDRLNMLAEMTGQHQAEAAGSLLADLLDDQEFWDGVKDSRGLNLN